MKKLVCILLAAFMLAGGAAVALSGTATTAQGEYSFFPDECEFCIDYCIVCIEFIFTYYPTYWGRFSNGDIGMGRIIEGRTWQDMIDTTWERGANAAFNEGTAAGRLEFVRIFAEVIEEYQRPGSVTIAIEFMRLEWLVAFASYFGSGFAPSFVEVVVDFGLDEDFVVSLAFDYTVPSNLEQIAAHFVAINDAIVEYLEDQGVEVLNWLRSTTSATPVCPVDPNAPVCLCEAVTTTTTTSTTEPTTTTEATTTSTTTSTTTTATSTTQATTTTTSTTQPPSSSNNWLFVLIGILFFAVIGAIAALVILV